MFNAFIGGKVLRPGLVKGHGRRMKIKLLIASNLVLPSGVKLQSVFPGVSESNAAKDGSTTLTHELKRVHGRKKKTKF